MTTDAGRTVGWKRFLRLVGALALPATAVLGFGAATVHTVRADGPTRCESGPDRVAHEGCGERDQRCDGDGECDRNHDRDGRPTPTQRPRSTLGPTPMSTLTPTTAPTTAREAASVPAAAVAASPRGPDGSPAASSAASPTAAPSPSPAGVRPVSLPPARPAPILVDLPLVRLLVIAVVVGVAAAVLPRAVRRSR